MFYMFYATSLTFNTVNLILINLNLEVFYYKSSTSKLLYKCVCAYATFVYTIKMHISKIIPICPSKTKPTYSRERKIKSPIPG